MENKQLLELYQRQVNIIDDYLEYAWRGCTPEQIREKILSIIQTISDKLKCEAVMDKSYCQGCEQNFYNGNNPHNIKECWSFEKAKLVMKKQVGMDDVPPWTHTPKLVPSCYRVSGFIMIDADKTC